MRNAAYAVHTAGCTFLLDEAGVCRYLSTRSGVVSGEARACVGAQFVASLHPDLDGCLASDLVVGAAALFVRTEQPSGRQILLRSGEVLRVDSARDFGRTPPDIELRDDALDLSASQPAYAATRGGDTMPPPAFPSSEGPVLEEITRTLTVPLYDADRPNRLTSGR